MASDVKEQMQDIKVIGILLLAIVAFVGGGMLTGGNLVTGNFFADQPADNSSDAEFEYLGFNEYTVPVQLESDQITSSDTVYVVSADAEAPENYGDHTVAASDISSDFSGDAEVYDTDDSFLTASDGMVEVSKEAIGANDEFQAGQELRVFTTAGDYTSFDTVSIPSEIEKFKYQQDSPVETLGVDVLQTTTSATQDSVTTSSGDGEYSKEVQFEVGEGTALMGDLAATSVGENVTELSVTVTADGEQVYSETSDGSTDGETIADVVTADFVEEEMGSNPVTAEDTLTVSVEAETSSDTGNGVTVEVNDLSDTQVASVSAP